MPDGLDALGKALTELKPTCSPPVRHRLSGPWEVVLRPAAPSLHVLVHGSCRVELDAPVWTRGLRRRTLVLAQSGVVGRIGSAGSSSEDRAGLISTELRLGGEDSLGLLASLPPVLVLDADRPAPMSFRSTLDALMDEVHAPTHGVGFVSARLCEALFVHALRMHMLDLAWDDRGWYRQSSTRSSGRHCRPRLACRRGICRCLLWLGRGSGAAAASADDCERSPESRPGRSCGACAFGVHGSFLPEVRATSTRSPPRSGFLAAKCSVGVSGGSSASLRPPTGEKLTVVRSPGHEMDALRHPAMPMKARPFTHGSPRLPVQRESSLLRPADEARPFTLGCPRPPVQRDPIRGRRGDWVDRHDLIASSGVPRGPPPDTSGPKNALNEATPDAPRTGRPTWQRAPVEALPSLAQNEPAPHSAGALTPSPDPSTPAGRRCGPRRRSPIQPDGIRRCTSTGRRGAGRRAAGRRTRRCCPRGGCGPR